MRRASWWLAGFAVLCDWLGSNTDFFPACGVPLPLSEYWLSGLERAEQSVAATELIVGKPVQEQSLKDLFDIEHPTPLQALCGTMTVDQGPQLCFLEDVTGAGKTEAAVLLTHRLMFHNGAAGQCDVRADASGLPTALFCRRPTQFGLRPTVREIYPKTFVSPFCRSLGRLRWPMEMGRCRRVPTAVPGWAIILRKPY